MIKFDEENQKRKIEELQEKEAEDFMQYVAKKSGIPYIDLSFESINTDALRLIPEEKAKKNQIAGFSLLGKKVSIASTSPEKEEVKAIIKDIEKEGYKPTLYVASLKSIKRAWERYGEISYSEKTEEGILEITKENLDALAEKFKTLDTLNAFIQESLTQKKSQKVSELVEVFITGAYTIKASDIHIEPEEEYTRLRFRLDGVLQNVTTFDHKKYARILSRIKLLAGVKLNIKDQAQDGRFSIKIGDVEIEIRASMIPGAYGESVVMRILNPDAISVPLEELGIEKHLFDVLEKEVSKPNGLIINTGPTGSGKTTTLYALLKKMLKPDVKILTIEDPIEYHLEGITQTQTDKEKGYTFNSGLRSALRQDPDIIMVGEIRDKETAETAIQASLTGHLVLSTLHTNSAAGAIPRFIDLGVNPKILGSAMNIILAQRLVRRLCEKCKKEYTASTEEKKFLEDVLQNTPGNRGPFNTNKLWKGEGCEVCNKTGYKGRIGLYEAVVVDSAVEKIATENPSEREIKNASRAQGMLDMLQDGVIKILQGVTDIPEIRRVIEVEEEEIV